MNVDTTESLGKCTMIDFCFSFFCLAGRIKYSGRYMLFERKVTLLNVLLIMPNWCSNWECYLGKYNPNIFTKNL